MIASALVTDDVPTILLVFSIVHLAVLLIWFSWTLWLSAKVAKVRGQPWTQSLMLRKVSMGRMVRENEWMSGDDIAMNKIQDDGSMRKVEVL